MEFISERTTKSLHLKVYRAYGYEIFASNVLGDTEQSIVVKPLDVGIPEISVSNGKCALSFSPGDLFFLTDINQLKESIDNAIQLMEELEDILKDKKAL